jgi:hypothetical protein
MLLSSREAAARSCNGVMTLNAFFPKSKTARLVLEAVVRDFLFLIDMISHPVFLLFA